MTTSNPLRRSSRYRYQTQTYYDEEKKRIEEEELGKRNYENDAAESDDDDHQEEDNDNTSENNDNGSMDVDDDESESDDNEASSDEEYESKSSAKKANTKTKSKKVTTASTTTPKSNQKSKPNLLSPIQQLNIQRIKSRTFPSSTSPKKKTKSTTTTMTTSTTATKSNNPKTIQNALDTLSTKILQLDSNRHPIAKHRLHSSLFLSLLQYSSKRNNKNQKSNNPQQYKAYHENDMYYTQPVTKYTNTLSTLSFDLITDYNQTLNNPTKLHVKLLNLLFLSIGGTSKSMIVLDDDENEYDDNETEATTTSEVKGQRIQELDDLDSDDWNDIITTLVNDMRDTPLEYIPFCCDPYGALHWDAMKQEAKKEEENGRVTVTSERDVIIKRGNSTLVTGVQEYRSIFEEFWYVLGTVALMEGGMSNKKEEAFADDDDEKDPITSSDDEGEEIDGTSKKRKRRTTSTNAKKKRNPKKKYTSTATTTSTTRFDSEIVTGILSLINEFVSAGQPDVRAVATTAAIFLLHAIVDKSAFVKERLAVSKRQYDAATKTKSRSSGTGAKVESLQHQIDSLERTLNDLEHIIEASFINAIFMHRYRDSNMYIRASCLHALGRMTIVRPDFFLKDKYLKYFGWMMSDKAECVRVAALSGLYCPFQFKDSQQQSNKLVDKIDLMSMERVVTKFLPRIVDCVVDIHESVQEVAMMMLLSLLRNEFLDKIDDEDENKDLMTDEMWDQVNLMALETQTSALVRRDALYFIMEQLEDFDDGEDEDLDDINHSKGKKSKSIASNISDRRMAQRLDAIASWAAHTLTAGKVPIEKIRIHLVDYLVHSLRSMPEHKQIITNWASMVRAITEDNIAMTSEGTSAGERADVAKQRVLVRMLICAAKAEVESVDAEFLYRDIDGDIVDILRTRKMGDIETGTKKKTTKASTNLQHESLSIALIKALPNLLVQFKSDPAIIDSLVSLPRYFIPSVFSLPQRKSDFVALTKNLSNIYLQSNDDNVLTNASLSLVSLCKGEHARVAEAKKSVNKCLVELHDRILTHLSSKEGDNEEELERQNIDKQYSLYYNLKRIRVLSSRLNFSEYMGNNEDADNQIEYLCNFVSDGLAHRLTYFKSKLVSNTEERKKEWDEEDRRYLQVTSLLIYEGMSFLLTMTAWKVYSMQEEHKLVEDRNDPFRVVDDEDEDVEEDVQDVDHVVIRLRDRLIVLVELCFEQHLPDQDDDEPYSDVQQEWSDCLQEIGGVISSDLRSLFLQEWSTLHSPLLRAASITDDSRLIAGYIRHFCSNESKIMEDEEDARSLILPLVRGLASNWKLGNRREASYALSHITGSGQLATEMIECFSKLLKKVEPVRLLEAHMASLRLSYENWLNNDPEEMMGDNLTQGTDDVTMNAFQELEREHEKQFTNVLSQAQKFSSSLGVRKLKLSDEKLTPGLLGFMREGIRYSFSGDDDLLLGCRLSFLSIMSKYSQWIKSNASHLFEIEQFLGDNEAELKRQEIEERESAGEDFEGIHEDDLRALSDFRSSLGLEESKIFSLYQNEVQSTYDDTMTPDSSRFGGHSELATEDTCGESRDLATDIGTPSVPSSSKARKSRGSVGSALSRMSSARSSLPPLYEAQDGEDESSNNYQSSSGFKSEITDEGTPNTYDNKVPKSTGMKSDNTVGVDDDDSHTSLISPSAVARTQSTFDGEQSDDESSSN